MSRVLGIFWWTGGRGSGWRRKIGKTWWVDTPYNQRAGEAPAGAIRGVAPHPGHRVPPHLCLDPKCVRPYDACLVIPLWSYLSA